jgi:hypothetical protein
MNLYFLVEGRRSEMNVYPRWLGHLLPHISRVPFPDAVSRNTYFLVSGLGFPRLLDVQLPHAIADVNQVGRFDYLILCLDADEFTLEERMAEVAQHVAGRGPKLIPSTTLKVVIQNRCIETWFLGNVTVFKRNPQSRILRDYIDFFDVSDQDPEAMGIYTGFDTHADFHHAYLREMFAERNIRYSKNNPGPVQEEPYLRQLIHRVENRPNHLLSLQEFLAFCRKVDELSRPRPDETTSKE